MANICNNTMVIYGNPKIIKQIHQILEKAKTSSLDEIAKLLGVKAKIDCNYCNILYIQYGFNEYSGHNEQLPENADHFEIAYESKWNSLYEDWNAIVDELDLKQVTMAEEDGEGYYINTDKDGKFLKERYLFHAYRNDEFEEHYFDDLESALDYLSQFFNRKRKFKTFDDAERYCNNYNSRHSENFANFYEFSLS